MTRGRAGTGDTVAGAWRETYERLAERDPASLSPDELDLLADALFWLDRPDESVEVRRDAYRAHVADHTMDRATLAAWRLFYDHFLVGEVAVANGWLERARRHASDAPGSVESGWLDVAEADRFLADGRARDALEHADRAVDAGRRHDDPDLMAMALQAKGRVHIALDQERDGVALLDEAMVAVVNDELDPLFTGWVFCNVISACHARADLGRAAEWSDAAMRWCDALQDGRMYPGLCRVYSVELACLRGTWEAAEADARRACDELTTHDPRFAGEAFYMVGELARLRGDFEAAQEAFARAHELGRVPQPGLALVRMAEHREADAAKALRAAPRPAASALLPRAQLLDARLDAELAVGDEDAARAAAEELRDIAESSASPMLGAIAAAADGKVLLARGDAVAANRRLRDACNVFQQLGLPYEAAQTQVRLGLSARAQGDDDTAGLEMEAARAAFERLGARPDADRVLRLLGEDPAPRARLTDRELEVLGLVTEGFTNREIAEALTVSRHTVARHLSNIFTKIGVTSRSAATAYAYEHELV